MGTSRGSVRPDYLPMALPLISLRRDFPAKTLATPSEEAADSEESEADCSSRSFELLASWSREESCWKTSQGYLEGGLTSFSGSWPRSGMMRNGTAYRLRSLGPGIRGTASGYLPTPVSLSDAKGSPADRYWGSATYRGLLREALRDGPDDGVCPHPSFVEVLMGFPIGWTELSS